MATITNSGEDVIHNELGVEPQNFSDDSDQSVYDLYEINRTANEIISNNWCRIGLQFPDELLHDSVKVYKSLLAELDKLDSSVERKAYVMADTTYNSCCVDEVSAQHVDADVIVHYGHACLEPTARLPVIYVFGKRKIDIDTCVEVLTNGVKDIVEQNSNNNKALVCSDVSYTWKAEEIFEKLRNELNNILDSISLHPLPPTVSDPISNSGAPEPVVTRSNAGINDQLEDHEPDGSKLSQDEQQLCNNGCECNSNINNDNNNQHCCDTSSDCCNTSGKNINSKPLPLPVRAVEGINNKPVCDQSTILLYIGPPSLKLTNLVLTNYGVNIFTFNPLTNSGFDATSSENRLLQRRYAQVHKARDADVFGLAVGTLSTSSYLPLVKHLRQKLQNAQKKVYTVAVGKLNPAKLGNFGEIECWCIIACGENSIVNSKDFHVPVITPFELEMALDKSRIWTGEYVLDFSELLNPNSKYNLSNNNEEVENDEENDDDQPQFSAATGKFKKHRKFGTNNQTSKLELPNVDALTLRTAENALQIMNNSAAGDYLQNSRSWKGLEVREGQDEPSLLEIGRSGIAKGYVVNSEKSGAESNIKKSND